MRHLTFALLLLGISFISYGAKTKPTRSISKSSKTKIYRLYLKENMNLRLQQEKKMYLKQLAFLKKNHEIRLKYFMEINNLKMKMRPKNGKINKKIKKLIKSKKMAFQTENKARRESFFKDTVKKDMDIFKSAMIKRRQQLSAKLKIKSIKSKKSKI
jgi:hypothetical protein